MVVECVTAVVGSAVASADVGIEVVAAGVVGLFRSVTSITIRKVASIIHIKIEENISWRTDSPAHCPW